MHRRLSRLLPLVALVALSVAPAGSAKSPPKGTFKVSRGQTTVTWDAGYLPALQQRGIVPTIAAPAKGGASGPSFPVSNGRLNAITFAGTIRHTGGVTFTKGATVVTLRNLIVTLAGEQSRISALVGDSRVELFRVDLGALQTKKTRTSFEATGAKITLLGSAAQALNARFGLSGADAIPEGFVVGTAAIKTRVVGKGAKNKGR